ncbi:MAG: RnfABCDGE type electron transport complex subunit B [Clostridia bacterium]|nr:RnfABCDGE type electron transport complex subunit B [Clostridia bacterium]
MQISDVLIPVGIFAALGVLFGIVLAVASKVFAVKVDERVPQIIDCLPGANCGGCGYSGCAALAEAIVKGEASPNACNAGSAEGIRRIGEIMGIAVSDPIPVHAQVKCMGTCHTATFKYRYEGAQDCIAAERMGGGDKLCANGCIGLGTCVAACKYDAIAIVDGVAVVDTTKCIGCGACAAICPKKLIVMLPAQSKYSVLCRSVENGATTRKYCKAGCIGCRICEKNCPAGAVTVDNFVASIDQNKCTGCGICAEKCPRKIIHRID